MPERIGIVVQARMESERLPGKALLQIEGVPLLRRLCNRVAMSRLAHALIVATSDEPEDWEIGNACRGWDLPVHHGPKMDLVARLLGAAEAHGLTALVRVTADNPLTDPEGVDALVSAYRAGQSDLVHNKHRRGYPYGTGAEIVSVDALRRCAHLIADPGSREEFIGWMKTQTGVFRCVAINAPSNLIRPEYFLTVDYSEDVELFGSVYRHFKSDDGVPLERVLLYLDEHPDVARINQHLHAGFPD